MNLFKDKDVIVGTPTAYQDEHRHQPNGDSVVSILRARREYEEDMRRQRPREIAEKIFEGVAMVVAVIGFGGIILWNAADLFNKHGVAVPISIIFAVMIVSFVNRKRH